MIDLASNESARGAGIGDTAVLTVAADDGPPAAELFLDIENLARSVAALGVQEPPWHTLAAHICEKATQQLGLRPLSLSDSAGATHAANPGMVYCRAIWAFASEPINVHPDDRDAAERDHALLEDLRALPGMHLQTWPRDLRGRRMSSLPPREERREKFVDGALNTILTKRCESGNPPAVIALGTGDADFIPALKDIREDHPEIHIFVAAFADALSGDYRSGARVGVEWQHPPLLLDEWLAGQLSSSRTRMATAQNDGLHKKGAASMISVLEHDGNSDKKSANTWSGTRDLRVGRMMVNWPMFARLDVYTKKGNGQLGATVNCDEDGGRYGVTPGVLGRYPEPGTYIGWVWVDRPKLLAFRFDAGDATRQPAPLLSIESSCGRVEVEPKSWAGPAPEHGAPVAFRARVIGRTPLGRQRLRTTQILPLDQQHVLVIANLISGGELSFPDHSDVLQVFFDTIGKEPHCFSRNPDLLDSALGRLAARPDVPAEFQMLARVERTRRSAPGDDLARGAVCKAPAGPGDGPGRGTGSTSAGSASAAGDVAQVRLQLD